MKLKIEKKNNIESSLGNYAFSLSFWALQTETTPDMSPRMTILHVRAYSDSGL